MYPWHSHEKPEWNSRALASGLALSIEGKQKIKQRMEDIPCHTSLHISKSTLKELKPGFLTKNCKEMFIVPLLVTVKRQKQKYTKMGIGAVLLQ